MCIGDKRNPNSAEKIELDITKLGNYIIKCLKRMEKTLTAESEAKLFHVIGEVMANAEEHATTHRRYSIGYFQESNGDNGHIGVFNFVIMNFGNTIYEKFKSPDCLNHKIINEMNNLSSYYNKNSIFKTSKFKEETLWTLYALQEGVTSIADKRRGNGSINFIESFSLKGDNEVDNMSKLAIVSGNARIIFDGRYRIIEKKNTSKTERRTKYKTITFNDSGNLRDKPNEKYVRNSNNYFPGTMISAKIYIKEQNIESNQ